MHTVTDLAERFAVSRDTVISWIHSGQLPAIDVAPAGSPRSFYRVSEENLRQFEESRRVGTSKPASKPAILRNLGKIREYV